MQEAIKKYGIKVPEKDAAQDSPDITSVQTQVFEAVKTDMFSHLEAEIGRHDAYFDDVNSSTVLKHNCSAIGCAALGVHWSKLHTGKYGSVKTS